MYDPTCPACQWGPKLVAQSELSATPCSAIRGYKEDHRPPRHGWADGHYLNKCHWCSENFIGDKRAVQCADCAYKDSPNAGADLQPRRKE